jgi:TonB family protein
MPRHLSRVVLILICFAQSGFARAQEQKASEAPQVVETSANKTTPPVLVSKSDFANCQSSFVSKTRFEGTTRLKALIDSAGQAIDVTVSSSSGSQELDDAAVACLKNAHFQVAMREGQPAPGEFRLNVKWELPPSVDACSPSMPVGWIVVVNAKPSPKEPSPFPPTAESVVCICMNGTETSEPIIVRSSGIQQLDEAAIKLQKQAPKGGIRAGCSANEFRFITKPAPRLDGGK